MHVSKLNGGVVVAALLLSLAGGAARGQTPAPPSSEPVNVYGVVVPEPSSVSGAPIVEDTKPDTSPAAADKRGEFVLAPIPMVNPTLENGLFLLTGYLFRLDPEDHVTPASIAMVGGFGTTNGSWGGVLMHNLHLAHDRFRVLGVFNYSDVNYDFHGIGQDAGDSGLSIELNQAGPGAIVDGLVRVAPKLYVGGRYQIMRKTVSTKELEIPGGPTLPGLDAELRTAGLGPRLEYDSRDNPFYPRRGVRAQALASFFGHSLGGNREYQMYQASMNGYHGVGERQVVAWHVGACGVDGPVPFYDLCQLGRNQDLRGYPMGQYRDRTMFATQAEWRTELWWRLGAAVFAGVGEVAPDVRSFTSRNLMPGAGAGLRFALAKRSHLNLRVDYAWGRDSRALYLSVGEAF